MTGGADDTLQLVRDADILVGQVVDVRLGEVRDDRALRFRSGRLCSEIQIDKWRVDRSAQVLDYRELACVPAFRDWHVHFALNPKYSPQEWVEDHPFAERLDYAIHQGETAVRAGVTWVRDMGGDHVVQAARARTNPGTFPRMATSGRPLTGPAGHFFYLGREMPGDLDIVGTLRRHLSEGHSWVKVMMNGGYLTPGTLPWGTQFDESFLAEVTRIAHGLGLLVAVHAHSLDAISACLVAGVDSIEHCTFLDGEKIRLDEGLLKGLAQNHITVVPGLVDRPGVGFDREHLAGRKRLAAAFQNAGVEVLAGTDAGVIDGLDLASLPWALLTLRECGLSPLSCLRASTVNTIPGMSDECVYALANSSACDLIITDVSPLSSLQTILEPRAVLRSVGSV